MLNVTEIKSYEESTREIPQEKIEPGYGIHKITRLPPKHETQLRLTLSEGRIETLSGAEADNALRILKSSAS